MGEETSTPVDWPTRAKIALSCGLPAAMRQALFAQRRGRPDEACAIYYAILERDPENFDAIHCCGLAEFDRRNYERAAYLVGEAVKRHPEIGIAVDNLAQIEAFMTLWRTERDQPKPTRPTLNLQRVRKRLSVVMPAYNHERFIAQAIESVLGQTVEPDEVIVVDDGSTDRTAEIAAGYPVLLVRQPNSGAHAALNLGLECATGECIALANSDDLWAPSRLERLLAALDRENAGLAFSMTRFIDDVGHNLPLDLPYIQHLIDGMERAIRDGTPAEVLRHTNIAISSGNFVFRRELLAKTGGFAAYRICHDWDFLLAATAVAKVVMVPERLYVYRLHPGNSYDKQGLRGRWEMEQILSGLTDDNAVDP